MLRRSPQAAIDWSMGISQLGANSGSISLQNGKAMITSANLPRGTAVLKVGVFALPGIALDWAYQAGQATRSHNESNN